MSDHGLINGLYSYEWEFYKSKVKLLEYHYDK